MSDETGGPRSNGGRSGVKQETKWGSGGRSNDCEAGSRMCGRKDGQMAALLLFSTKA